MTNAGGTVPVLFLVLFLFSGCSSSTGSAAIRGGTWLVGTPDEELDRLADLYPGVPSRAWEGEAAAREVTLAPFRIDLTEITVAQFAAFVERNQEWRREMVLARGGAASYLDGWEGVAPPRGDRRLPAANVTWDAADAYCRWAGGRLPTEAEWEVAARGGVAGKLYPWGDEAPDPSRVNYAASDLRAPVTVASYPANPFGLFDVAGNVWEWTADPWPSQDGSRRYVIRGGSYGGAPINLRVAYRDSHRAADPKPYVGFRCAY